MGNIFSIRLTDEDKVHLQQRMDETGKNATEVFKSAIYFTKIDADLVDEIIANIGYYASEKDLEGIKEEVHRYVLSLNVMHSISPPTNFCMASRVLSSSSSFGSSIGRSARTLIFSSFIVCLQIKTGQSTRTALQK